jgi:hypothetical protein
LHWSVNFILTCYFPWYPVNQPKCGSLPYVNQVCPHKNPLPLDQIFQNNQTPFTYLRTCIHDTRALIVGLESFGQLFLTIISTNAWQDGLEVFRGMKS